MNWLMLAGCAPSIRTLTGSAGIAGMPKQDVVLATAISTGVATMAMGLVANYPVCPGFCAKHMNRIPATIPFCNTAMC